MFLSLQESTMPPKKGKGGAAKSDKNAGKGGKGGQ